MVMRFQRRRVAHSWTNSESEDLLFNAWVFQTVCVNLSALNRLLTLLLLVVKKRFLEAVVVRTRGKVLKQCVIFDHARFEFNFFEVAHG
jgi:hypothetical protein